MKKLIHQLGEYVEGALSISIEPRPWEKSSELPQYLRARYRFFHMDVLGTDCVLMADTDEGEQTPAVIGKHVDQVRSRHDVEVVYVRHAVTSYNRKRLIEQKVPFIVPGNQMYLPSLGIDLREHLKRLRGKKAVFSPSTQALLLHVLWKKETDKATPADIAKRLGYSAMTMTRAFDELGSGRHRRAFRSGERATSSLCGIGQASLGKGVTLSEYPGKETVVYCFIHAAKKRMSGRAKRPGPLHAIVRTEDPGFRIFFLRVEDANAAG